jgi:hypothetical protein
MINIPNLKKTNLDPVPQPQQPVQPAPDLEPTQAPAKKLVPNGTQYFDNDLDDEAKQKILDSFVESAKAILAEDKVTVNSVAKLFSVEHSKVKKQWECSASLKDFIASRSDSSDLAKVKRSIARLTPEERELLKLQLG